MDIILYGGDMSPCTGSWVNANYEQIASWDRCQFATRGPQNLRCLLLDSAITHLTLPWPIWLCHDPSDSAMTHLTLPRPIWLCDDPSDSVMTHLTLPWPIWLCHDPSDSAMTHLTLPWPIPKNSKGDWHQLSVVITHQLQQPPWQQGSWGQHGAHLGPTGPRWAPCWPHDSCHLGSQSIPGRINSPLAVYIWHGCIGIIFVWKRHEDMSACNGNSSVASRGVDGGDFPLFDCAAPFNMERGSKCPLKS